MEANLKFNLNTVDDELRYYQCVHSAEMASALHEIAYNLRKKVEWDLGSRLDNPDPVDIVFEMIAEIIDNNGVPIDKIMV